MRRFGKKRESFKSEDSVSIDKQTLDDVTGGGRDPQAGHTPPGKLAFVATKPTGLDAASWYEAAESDAKGE